MSSNLYIRQGCSISGLTPTPRRDDFIGKEKNPLKEKKWGLISTKRVGSSTGRKTTLQVAEKIIGYPSSPVSSLRCQQQQQPAGKKGIIRRSSSRSLIAATTNVNYDSEQTRIIPPPSQRTSPFKVCRAIGAIVLGSLK